MAAIVRVLLWVLLVIAPGGVFLLPLLLGDEVARRRKRAASIPDGGIAHQGVPVEPHPATAVASGH